MSFNAQDFLETLGRLGAHNSTVVSALQQAVASPAIRPVQQSASLVNLISLSGGNSSGGVPAPAGPSTNSSIAVAQIQAILAARASQQNIAEQGFATASYNTGTSQHSKKEDLQQTLATLLVKQKLQQAQNQSRSSFTSVISGTCSFVPSLSAAAVAEGKPSPLQQMLGKIIQINAENLKQAQDTRASSEDESDRLIGLSSKNQQQQQQQRPLAAQDLHGFHAAGVSQGNIQANIENRQRKSQEERKPASTLSQNDTIAALLSSLQNQCATASIPQAVPSHPFASNRAREATLDTPEQKRRRGRSGSFPQKIHQMLRDLEEQGRQDIASFVREGTAFCIHRPNEFAKEVMPKYFKMGSYASFQRQLNLYNFTRIAEGPERGSYFHKLFLQGKPLLSTTMKRKEAKKPAPKSAKALPTANA